MLFTADMQSKETAAACAKFPQESPGEDTPFKTAFMAL